MDDRQNEILRWLRESKIETDDLEVALAEVRSRRDELLAHGHKAGLSVAEMARAAGIAHVSASRIIHHGRSWQPRRAA